MNQSKCPAKPKSSKGSEKLDINVRDAGFFVIEALRLQLGGSDELDEELRQHEAARKDRLQRLAAAQREQQEGLTASAILGSARAWLSGRAA